MKDELLKVCDLYKSVYVASRYGEEKGMSVKELKKKYGLKQRDIRVLLEYLASLAYMSRDSKYHVEFDVLRYDEKGKLLDDVDIDYSEIDDEDYIYVYDRIDVIHEKLTDEDIDYNNETFLDKLNSIEDNPMWDKISNVTLDNCIINKGKSSILSEELLKHKLSWIEAVLKQRKAKITHIVDGKKIEETVVPLGLYYIGLLNEYRCVYRDNNGYDQENDLQSVINICPSDEVCKRKFNLDSYLEKKRQKDLWLRVYKEGNVIAKLDRLLYDYKHSTSDMGDYLLYKIKTDDVWQFENVINGFGRSVIVEKPDDYRKHFEDEALEALNFLRQKLNNN
jgi:hypothetical protein